MSNPPTIVVSLPRSGSSWLAAFIESVLWTRCSHDPFSPEQISAVKCKSDFVNLVNSEVGKNCPEVIICTAFPMIMEYISDKDFSIIYLHRDAKEIIKSCEKLGFYIDENIVYKLSAEMFEKEGLHIEYSKMFEGLDELQNISDFIEMDDSILCEYHATSFQKFNIQSQKIKEISKI